MSLTMDDRDGFIWLDGKLVPWRDSRVHVLTHALHYGSAVFEGERIYDGRIFRLAAHSARLINSARLLDYEIPWTRAEIEEATRAVVKANGLQAGYIRPDRLARLGGAWASRASARRCISPSRRGPRKAGCRCRRAIPASTSPWRNIAARRPISHPAMPRWRASTSSAASRRTAR